VLTIIHSLVRYCLLPCLARDGVLVGRYESVIGSNFHFCVARLKFSQSAFLNGCVNVDSIVRKFCSLQIDDKTFWCSTVYARLYITA